MPAPSSKDLRIVFAGTPDFAARHLDFLLQNGYNIVATYTQPDRPAGRGKKLQQSAVKKVALGHGLPVLQPLNFKDPEAVEELAALKADLMIVVAYGLILPQSVLDLPVYGCLNIHASLLPRWRGAAPIQRAIEAGDKETGVTIMQMNAGLDTGDMLTKAVCQIDNRDNSSALHDKLIEVGKPALQQALDQLSADQLKPEKQNDEHANYAAKIDKAEAEIDWQEEASLIDRKIRAFNPFPVCFFYLGDQRIKVHKAFVLENHSLGQPGLITQLSDQGIDVQTGKGSVRIETLQIPGKKPLPCGDVLRGNAQLFSVGGTLSSPASEHSS